MAMNSGTQMQDTVSITISRGDKRYIKELKVAILYTESGSWYTGHGLYDLVIDSIIATMVEERNAQGVEVRDPYNDRILYYIKDNYSVDLDAIRSSIPSLAIKWVDIGDKYRIVKVDGREVVELLTDTVWFEA